MSSHEEIDLPDAPAVAESTSGDDISNGYAKVTKEPAPSSPPTMADDDDKKAIKRIFDDISDGEKTEDVKAKSKLEGSDHDSDYGDLPDADFVETEALAAVYNSLSRLEEWRL
jgi:hypothetical protein